VKAAVTRLWRLYHTPQGRKLVRYAIVSIVSAVIAFSVLTLVYGVLQLWTEVPSALFSNIVSTVPNYFLNRRWVWGKSGRSHLWREVVPFWVMSITGIVLALLTASLARHFSNEHDLGHVARTVVIVGANTFAFGTLWVLKFLILNRLFRTFPTPDRDEHAGAGSPVGTGSSQASFGTCDPGQESGSAVRSVPRSMKGASEQPT
jgi:putative flippase GtrA